jgi:cytochrome c oxidase assembly factor CtaG
MNIFEIILTIIGGLFIIYSFIVNTKNTKSELMFQVFPFISGCYCIFFALLTSQILKINI